MFVEMIFLFSVTRPAIEPIRTEVKAILSEFVDKFALIKSKTVNSVDIAFEFAFIIS